MQKFRWDKDKNGELTLQNVCQIYSSENLQLNPTFFGKLYLTKGRDQFVIQMNKTKNASSGWLLEQTWFVINGMAQLIINDEIFNLISGDYIKIPTGNYSFKLLETNAFEYIWVCKLPNDFPKIANNPNAFNDTNLC